MRRVLFAAGALLSLAMGTAANATVTIDGSSMSTTGPTTIANTTSIGYSDTENTSPFQEYLDFTNTLIGSYTFTLTTSSPQFDFTEALVCAGTALCTPGTAVAVLSEIVDTPTFEFWDAGPSTLGSGQYSLWIEGTDNTDLGGSLGGSITIAAVPEPATWAMLLLGFLGVGFAMTRRRKDAPALLQLA
jgi:hypothetical protein